MRRAASPELPSQMNTVGMVLSHPRYAFVAIATALIILMIALFLPKITMLRFIVTFLGYALGDRLNFFVSTFFSFGFFPTIPSKITVVALPALSGLQVSLLWYFLAHRIASYRAGGLGVVGIIMGLIGIGCAACGSVVLVSLVGLSATVALLAVLPFKGVEVSAAAILMLLISLYFIAGKIRDPLICKVTYQ